MKISRLLSIIVIAVIGFYAYNFVILDPPDVIADDGETVVSSRRSHRDAFGFDSQMLLNENTDFRLYSIGVVTAIDLEKNDDGTWYVHNCGLKHGLKRGSELINSIQFMSPYPQQYDLKVGDFIGFSGTLKESRRRGRFYYNDGLMLENISSQSVNYNIDNISGLTVPVESGESLTTVTGLIMAVEIKKNENPEPDNPDDYLIGRALMKCADGNLYIADFDRRVSKVPNIKPINLPNPNAFGEGDIVTVMQTSAVRDHTFRAYYKKFKRVVTKKQRTETAKPDTDSNRQSVKVHQAVRDAESDAEATANKWLWFGGTCVGTTFLSCIACGLPSMAIAYFYEPAAPTSRLIGKSPEYVESYQKTYKEKVRSHQVSRATWGCIVGSIGFLYLVGRGTSL